MTPKALVDFVEKTSTFEQADPIIIVGSSFYPYGVTVTSALPDWTYTVGGVMQTQMLENDPSLGAPWVSLIGHRVEPHLGTSILYGNYSVLLQGSGIPPTSAISQTGLIPASAQSLLFEAEPGVWFSCCSE